MLALAGCGQNSGVPKQSCPELRKAFDRAFAQAVEAGAARNFEEQTRQMNDGQKAFLAMEDEGCCKEKGACPALNVR
jgi:hypothetical protein